MPFFRETVFFPSRASPWIIVLRYLLLSPNSWIIAISLAVLVPHHVDSYSCSRFGRSGSYLPLYLSPFFSPSFFSGAVWYPVSILAEIILNHIHEAGSLSVSLSRRSLGVKSLLSCVLFNPQLPSGLIIRDFYMEFRTLAPAYGK